MNTIKKYASYLPLAFLLFTFAVHSIKGFMGSEEYFTIIGVLGLSSSLTTTLVYLIGPLDGAVALLLLFKGKVLPKLPWLYIYVWAGLWPWVPRVLEGYGGLEMEWGEAAFITVVAALAYYLHQKRQRHF